MRERQWFDRSKELSRAIDELFSRARCPGVLVNAVNRPLAELRERLPEDVTLVVRSSACSPPYTSTPGFARLARTRKQSEEELLQVPLTIGRLIGFTRQLDTQMVSQKSIAQGLRVFFNSTPE